MFVSVDFHFFSWTKTTTKGRANNKKLLDNFEGKVIKDFKSNKSWGLLLIIRLIIALIHLWPRWAVYFESLDACSQSCTGRRRRCWWGWSTRSACCCWAGQLRDFLDRLGWQEKVSVRRGTVEENAPAGDLAASRARAAAAGTTQISLPNVENGHDDRSDLLGLVVQCRTTTPLALVRKFPRASV